MLSSERLRKRVFRHAARAFARSEKGAYPKNMKRIWVVLILAFSFFGIADSGYLAQHEIDGTPLLCSVQNLSGCNIVATSTYSHVFGVPLAVFGVFFYGVLFVLAALELVFFDRLLRRLLQGISLIGIVASLYFSALQWLVIGAFCIYCTASTIIAILLFISAARIEPLPRYPRRSRSQSPTIPPSHLPMPPAT